MHAIVTGGAGFVGSHLVRRLVEWGYKVTVIDNLSTGSESNLLKKEGVELVVSSIQAWEYTRFKQPVDVLFHLAANASVQASWQEPLSAHGDNLTATLKVAQIARDLNIKRVVYASSAAVYGVPKTLPVDENHSQSAISPYGFQKLWGEFYLKLFAKQYGFSVVALRLFNVFGPGQNPASHYSGVITLFSNAMRKGENICVFGNGKQTRDFIFVEDVVRAFVDSSRLMTDLDDFDVFNIGTGRQLGLLELINALRELIPDWKGTIEFKDALPGDIRDSVANTSKATRLLGFGATVNLKEGLMQLLKG